MNIPELKKLCISSAEVYLNWLVENDKGIDIIDVHSITSTNNQIKLKLSSNIYDRDLIIIRYLPTGKDYENLLQVIKYDYEKRILIVKKGKNFPFELTEQNKDNIKIVSSLRFLVENVINWYKKNGDSLQLPTTKSEISDKISEFEFESDTSEEQKNAIRMIFDKPFSYVWGAPGTGKTRKILTQAMTNYLKADKKIIILAPTNNAIEQVLEAVIPIALEKGIELDRFFRIGNPSAKFSKAYPEICEVAGIEKKISKVNSRIELIENYNKILDSQNQLLAAKKSNILSVYLKDIVKYNDAIKQRSENLTLIEDMQEKIKSYESQIRLMEEKLVNLYIDKDRLKTKVLKIMRIDKLDYQRSIDSLNELIHSLKRSKEESIYKRDFKLSERENLNKIINKLIDSLTKNHAKLINIYVFLFDDEDSLRKELGNIPTFKDVIDRELKELESKLEIELLHYSEYSSDELQNQELIQSLYSEKEKLESLSFEERLKNVQVVACTLDNYIMKFSNYPFNTSHIFVDEAGYANAIKTLTIFRNNIPITLLGDHKQLPPVCELNDYEIMRNVKYKEVFLWHYTSTCIDSLFVEEFDINYNNFKSNIQFTTSKMDYVALSITFRFGDKLAKILGKFIYNFEFRSGANENNTEIYFINAAKRNSELKTRRSKNEVDAIKSLVKKLDSKNMDYAILTPYRKGQLKLLNNEIPKLRNEQKILTVHGSQGKEWDSVILSVVDTSDMFFTDTSQQNSKGRNLINTAVSRAKKNLFIIADSSYWSSQKNQLISELIKIGKEI